MLWKEVSPSDLSNTVDKNPGPQTVHLPEVRRIRTNKTGQHQQQLQCSVFMSYLLLCMQLYVSASCIYMIIVNVIFVQL